MTTPWQKYQLDLCSEEFQHDPAQEIAVLELQRLYDQLVDQKFSKQRKRNDWFSRLVKNTVPPIQGIYFWGGVGRGKPIW